MKKPFNVAFEFLSYAVSLLLLVAARRSSVFEGYVTKIWDYWVGAYFFAMVLLITARAALKKAEDRAVVSAFTFGFLSGAFLWSMYIINESRSEGLTLHAYVLVYILLFGCLAGGAAALCAYIARLILRTVWGSGVGS